MEPALQTHTIAGPEAGACNLKPWPGILRGLSGSGASCQSIGAQSGRNKTCLSGKQRFEGKQKILTTFFPSFFTSDLGFYCHKMAHIQMLLLYFSHRLLLFFSTVKCHKIGGWRKSLTITCINLSARKNNNVFSLLCQRADFHVGMKMSWWCYTLQGRKSEMKDGVRFRLKRWFKCRLRWNGERTKKKRLNQNPLRHTSGLANYSRNVEHEGDRRNPQGRHVPINAWTRSERQSMNEYRKLL